MRGGRILWGQIVIVLTIVFVMTWAATQWTAWRLGFQPQLGSPWFELAGWPIYYPPAFFWWWFSFDAYAPAIFMEGAALATPGGILAIAAEPQRRIKRFGYKRRSGNRSVIRSLAIFGYRFKKARLPRI